MGIIILLLSLILLVLVFGPAIMGAFAFLAAVVGSVALAVVLTGIGVIVGAYVLCLVLWGVWWLFDRKGAEAAFRTAQAAAKKEPRHG